MAAIFRIHTVTPEPFSAVEGGSCHIRREGDEDNGRDRTYARLRDAEGRLLELRRYL